MREPVGEPTPLAVIACSEQAQAGNGEEAGKSDCETSFFSSRGADAKDSPTEEHN